MPRFLNSRDLDFIKTISEEVIDYVSEQSVVLFKLSVVESKMNLYGESVGKIYHTPVTLMARVERDPTDITYEGFGADVTALAKFSFNRERLRTNTVPKIRDISGSLVSVKTIQNEQYGYPEIGDIILFDDTYFEIHNTREYKLVGGTPKIHDKLTNTFSDAHPYLMTETHMVRRSQIQIEDIVI